VIEVVGHNGIYTINVLLLKPLNSFRCE